ncbi:MAG: septum formation initiator family protein [Holosporales bacterium]|nr:septum formation initiator family protein [Holosporales bacterium]
MSLFGRFVGLPNSVKLAYKIAFVVIVFVYLVFHVITGENGLISYVGIKKQVEEREVILNERLAELVFLKRRVELLSSKTLDLDILEERCRVILNYCYPGDVVIRDKVTSLLR